MKKMSKIDKGYIQLNKFGEELCGDNISVKEDDNSIVITLADGLGSGVRANILSILTSKILSTMLSENVSIEECVATIANTLPVSKELDVAYSTFTSICMDDTGSGYIIEYDNPLAFLVRNGKCYDFDRKEILVDNKKIYESKIHIVEGDYIVCMSDGATHAGVGITLDVGWSREAIMEHLNRHIKVGMSASDLSLLVVSACNDLYLGEPSDDTTCMAVGLVKEACTTVMIGPPSKKEVDDLVCKTLIDSRGAKIVCGGTTAKLIARYLDKPIDMNYPIYDDKVPPISAIEGIDLVTEGAVTINEVVKKLKLYLNRTIIEGKTFDELDGASLICDYLINKSTTVNLLIGQTINVANEDSLIGVEDKQKNIRFLIKYLKQAGKTVNARFY